MGVFFLETSGAFFFQARKTTSTSALRRSWRWHSRSSACFVGQSTHTEEVALVFAQQLGQAVVLFPSSNISERTIQKAIPAEQVLEVTCYTTRENPIAVGHPDVLVFSSPSNVRAFFGANTLLHHQQIIAFGPSTAKQMAAFSSHPVQVLSTADSKSIVEAIKAALLC
jgi:uroporphyrinogen-III synthase